MTRATTLRFKKDVKIDLLLIRLTIVAAIIAVLNVKFIHSGPGAIAVITIELLILIFHLFKRNIVDYLGYYLIFLCLSVEFNTFVGSDNFYNFKNFRVFDINLGILCLIPITLLTLTKYKEILKVIKNIPNLYTFIKWLMSLNILGIIVGLIVVLINDNGVQALPSIISSFINELYSVVIYPWLLIISLLYVITFECSTIKRLKKYIYAVFIGIAISVIYSYLSKSIGYYAGVETLLVTSANFLLPFIILYPFYIKKHFSMLTFCLGIISTILILFYNANGKLIILCLLLPIVFLLILSNKINKLFVIIGIPFVIIILALIFNSISNMTSNSILLYSKFNQAMSLLNIWDQDWFANLPPSPKFRVGEFLNIFIEFLKNPFYFITGKGYMGTIKDHLQSFGQPYAVGTFSDGEWSIRSFYGMHETLNTLFLASGVPGLCFYFYMLKQYIRNLSKSFFYLVGGYWYLLFYGYSITISSLGLTCLILGMLEVNHREKGFKVNEN